MNKKNVVALACTILIGSMQLFAQMGDVAKATGYDPSAPFFTFSGSTRLYGESSSRQGSFAEKPRQFARWEFDPTFALFGFPISVSVLYSTEDSTIRQRINAANISLNPSILQNYIITRAQAKAEEYLSSYGGDALAAKDSLDKYRDSLAKYNPDRLRELEETVKMYDLRGMSATEILARRDLLESAGLLSTFEKVILWLPRVSYGTNYPHYSELTLSGIAVNGLDFEWNPGKFYLAFTTGSVLNPVQQYVRVPNVFQSFDSMKTEPIFARNLTAVRIGYGSKSSTYFILTGIKAKDDQGTEPDTTILRNPPQENYVLDFEGNLSFWEGRINLAGEVAASLLTSDIRASDIQIGDSSGADVPAIITDNLSLKISSFYDWSAISTLSVNVPESATRFNASFRRIGAGYRSLGLVNQRNDYIRYDIRADQAFLNRLFSIGGFIRRDKDNLIDWKRATTEISAWGVNFGITPRNLPYLRLTYAPYYQRNNSSDTLFKVDNTTSLFTALTGYSYQLLGVNNTTNLTYTTNSIKTYTGLGDFSLSSIQAGHSVSFQFPLTLSASVGIIQQQSKIVGLESMSILNLDFSAGYTIWDVWNLNGGINIAKEQSNSSRTGYFFSTSVPIWKIATLDIRAEKNVFSTNTIGQDQFLGSYNETIFRATLSRSW